MSTQGRFISPDNVAYSKTVDPQTWNQYVYCRNGPLTRIYPDGHNWFLIHRANGTDAWEWHSKKEVKKTKNGEVYTDKATGKTYTSKYTHLIIISVASGKNYSGANHATVTLYGKGFNDVKAKDTWAFAGGYGKGNEPPRAGEYFINLSKVGGADSTWTTPGGELAGFHDGFQYVPETTRDGSNFQGSWGHMRANLSRAAWLNGQPVFRDGNGTTRYLHGHESSRGWFGRDGTLGCVATPDEHVLNWLSHAIGNREVHPQIPTSVQHQRR